MGRQAWAPLLDGALAGRAARAVDDIADRLRALPLADCSRAFHLMAGDLGRAVFLAYHASWRGDERSAEVADAVLARAVECASACEVPAFYAGLAGMAWALEHTDGLLGGDGEPDDGPVAALDEILAADPASLDFEWLSGVAGWAILALERPRAPASARLLARIVDWMGGRGEPAPGGLRWRCPDWMPLAQDRVRFPDGCYPLDPAHGAMGPIAALAGCAAAGVAAERALALLEPSVGWLLAQRLPGSGALFPRCAGEREGGLGWCAGDPGVAGVLHAAGVALDRPDWREVAVEAARRTARELARAGQLDAGLCHGSAGLGHILGRIAHRSGDPEVAGAARRAFAAALDAAPTTDASLLTGSAGIGLALLAAASEIEPGWDRSLYLSF